MLENQYKDQIRIFFCLAVIFCALLLVPQSALAQSSSRIVTVLEDSYVDQDEPDKNFHEKHGEWLVSGWSIPSGDHDENKLQQSLSYLRFPLNEIALSEWDTVEIIDSIKLKLFVQTDQSSLGNNTVHYLTVHVCNDNTWKEDKITWNNRACNDNFKAEDILIVNSQDLPTQIEFDVTESIRDAKESNYSHITFIINSMFMPHDSDLTPLEDIVHGSKGALLWMWSKDRQSIGINASPILEVNYTIISSPFIKWIEYIAIVLTSLAIVVPVGFWFYKKNNREKAII